MSKWISAMTATTFHFPPPKKYGKQMDVKFQEKKNTSQRLVGWLFGLFTVVGSD